MRLFIWFMMAIALSFLAVNADAFDESMSGKCIAWGNGSYYLQRHSPETKQFGWFSFCNEKNELQVAIDVLFPEPYINELDSTKANTLDQDYWEANIGKWYTLIDTTMVCDKKGARKWFHQVVFEISFVYLISLNYAVEFPE